MTLRRQRPPSAAGPYADANEHALVLAPSETRSEPHRRALADGANRTGRCVESGNRSPALTGCASSAWSAALCVARLNLR